MFVDFTIMDLKHLKSCVYLKYTESKFELVVKKQEIDRLLG